MAIDSVKRFFQIQENYCVDTAFVNIVSPVIRYLKQSGNRRMKIVDLITTHF